MSGASEDNSGGMAKGAHDCAVELDGAIQEVLGIRGWIDVRI